MIATVRGPDGCLDRRRVEAEGVGFDVGEDWRGAGQGHRVRRRGEGERRHDHLVAYSDAGGHETEMSTGGSAARGDARDTGDQGVGEFSFEGSDLLALGEAPAEQNALDRGAFLLTDQRLGGRDGSTRPHSWVGVSSRHSHGKSPRTQDNATCRPPRVQTAPDRPTQPTRPAGIRRPGRSRDVRVTTAPAATIAHSPMVTGATQTARAPMEAPRRG